MGESAWDKRHWRPFMHELSIAMSILDIAEEEAERHANARVEAIHLRVGKMSGIVKEALLSAYELAAEQTPFAQSRLVFEDVPGRELQIFAMELAE
jgi:hydrogenase nickel incorporation protein HypA/HybF